MSTTPPELSFAIPASGDAKPAPPSRGKKNPLLAGPASPPSAAAAAPGPRPLAVGGAASSAQPQFNIEVSSDSREGTPFHENSGLMPVMRTDDDDEELKPFGAWNKSENESSMNLNSGSSPKRGNLSTSLHPSFSGSTAMMNSSTTSIPDELAGATGYRRKKSGSFRSASRAASGMLDVKVGEHGPQGGRMSAVPFDDKMGARARASMAAGGGLGDEERELKEGNLKRAASRNMIFSRGSSDSSDSDRDAELLAEQLKVQTTDEETGETLGIWDQLNKAPTQDFIPVPGLRHFRHDALFVFSPENRLRVFFFNLHKTKTFEAVIILLIVVNCIFLAIADPSAEPKEYENTAELFFTAAFTVEMVIKCIALGFVLHQDAYLRDPWNELDFVIVVMSYFTVSGLAENFSALRTFRVFRPLRSMNAVKGLKILVGSLIKAIKELVHIGTLSLSIIFMFAILGVQLFGDNMRKQCVNNVTGEQLSPRVWCGRNDTEDTYWGTGCAEGQHCVDLGEAGNPLGRYYSFDNTLVGMLVVFTFTTFEAWTVAVTVLQSTVGVIAFLYFFVTLIMVGFVLPNLVLAVINYEYVKLQEEETVRAALKRDQAKQRYNTAVAIAQLNQNKKKSNNRSASISFSDPGVAGGPPMPRAGSGGGNGTVGNPLSYPNSTTHAATSTSPSGGANGNGHHNHRHQHQHNGDGENGEQEGGGASMENAHSGFTFNTGGDRPDFSFPPLQAGTTNEDELLMEEDAPCCSWQYWGPKWDSLRDVMHQITEGFPRPAKSRAGMMFWNSASSSGLFSAWMASDRMSRRGSFNHGAGSVASFHKRRHSAGADSGGSGSGSESGDSDDDEEHGGHNPDTPLFGQFIIIMILLNTFVLATQHKNQPEWLEEAQTTCNFIFTIIFTVEMVMKWTSLGFKGYFKVSFNVLDCIIVIASLIELGLAGASVISVFRTLRLLRILKLFKQLPSLRAVVKVTMNAVRKTTYLLLIVGLYLFIVALLGVAIFNSSASIESTYGNRMTYENFVNAFLTSFQILAVDGWVLTMYELMDATNAAACLFFILQQLLGNFVLLSLFLSILIGSFDQLDEDEPDDDDDIPKGHGEHAVVLKLFDSGELKSVFGRVARKQGSGVSKGDEDSDDSVVVKDADEIPPKFARRTIKLNIEMKREFLRAARFFGVDLPPEKEHEDESSDSNKDEPAYYNRCDLDAKFECGDTKENSKEDPLKNYPQQQQQQQQQQYGVGANFAGVVNEMNAMHHSGSVMPHPAYNINVGDGDTALPTLDFTGAGDNDHDGAPPAPLASAPTIAVDGDEGAGGGGDGGEEAEKKEKDEGVLQEKEQISSASAAAAHRAKLAMLRRSRDAAAKEEEDRRRHQRAQQDSDEDNLNDLLQFNDLEQLEKGSEKSHEDDLGVEGADERHALALLGNEAHNNAFMVVAAGPASNAGSRMSKDDALSINAVAEVVGGDGAEGSGAGGRSGVQLAGLDLDGDDDDDDEDNGGGMLFKEDPNGIKHSNPEPLSARALERLTIQLFGGNAALANALLNGGKRQLTVYDISTEYLKHIKQSEDLGADAPLPEMPDMHDMRAMEAHRVQTPTSTLHHHGAGIAGGGDAVEFVPPVQSTLVLAEHKAAEPDPLPVRRRKWCKQCKQFMDTPLPAAPLVVEHTAEYVHRLQCKTICVRKAKEKVLGALLLVVDLYMSVNEAVRYDKVEAIVGQAWQCGMMLGTSVEEIMEAPDVWKRVEEELEEQRMVLSLRVGEEELGKSLIGYATRCVPELHKTNGSTALYLFGAKNPFRVFMSRVVHNEWFDRVIMTCILMNSVTMAITNPLDDPESQKVLVLDTFNVVFTSIFTAEMVMKLIALGFVLHPGSYLRDPWNWLDGFVVVISLVSDFATGVELGFLQVFRTMRALRPLRVINRNRGLKMVVRTLLESIKGIANIGLIICIVFLIFAILGVQLFGGLFQSCSDPSRLYQDECWGEWLDPAFQQHGNSSLPLRMANRTWGSEARNFDDVGNAFLTLFEICTGEAWIFVMWRSYDACRESAVTHNCSIGQGFFFVAFYAISGFFLIQLFAGIVVHKFRQVKEQLDGSKLLDDEQKLWISTQQLMLNFRPIFVLTPVEGSDVAHFLHHKIIHTVSFDAFIGIMIVLNIFAIACDYPSMSRTMEQVLEGLNYFFVAIFILEAIIKLIAYHWRYFESGWNQFDFFLVAISIIGLCLSVLQGIDFGVDLNILRIFRIFRILRVLRLVRRARKIKLLLETIYFSLPSLANVGGFVLLTDFVFGILGVDIFAKVYIAPDSQVLDNKFANFQSLDRALMLLFRFQTLEDWVGAMRDLMIEEPKALGSGSGTPFAAVYFFLYVTLCSYVITNLLIAVILDNFETTMKMEDSHVKMNDLHRFVEMWSKYDPEATMQMPTEDLPHLLGQLQTPLGFSRYHTRNIYHLAELKAYRIPEHYGSVHFIETLIPLARLAHEENGKLTKHTAREVREHEEIWKVAFPQLRELPFTRFNEHTVTVELYFAATYIVAAWRRTIALRYANQLRLEKISEILKHCRANGLDERSHVDSYTQHLHSRVTMAAEHVVSASLIEKQLRLHKRKHGDYMAGAQEEEEEEDGTPLGEQPGMGSMRRMTKAEREAAAARLWEREDAEQRAADEDREHLQTLMVQRSKTYSSANSFLSQLKETEEAQRAQQAGSTGWKRNKSEIIQDEVDERAKEEARRRRMEHIAQVSRRRQILRTGDNEDLSTALAPENSPAKKGMQGGQLLDHADESTANASHADSGYFMPSPSMRMAQAGVNGGDVTGFYDNVDIVVQGADDDDDGVEMQDKFNNTQNNMQKDRHRQQQQHHHPLGEEVESHGDESELGGGGALDVTDEDDH